MTGLFDEDELVFICSRHMIVQIAEKLRGISIRVGEALIPGSYDFSFTGVHIDSLDLSESVIGLGIDEIDVIAVQCVPYVVIKRVGVKIPVNAGDSDHDSIR